MANYTFNRQYDVPTYGPTADEDQREDIIETVGTALYFIGTIINGIKYIKNRKKNWINSS